MLEKQNLDTTQVLSVLELLWLSPVEKQVVAKSFRTRAKWIEDVLDFQFKYLEEGLQETEKTLIEWTIAQIGQKLASHYTSQKVTASCKIGVCCMQNCFCCTEYPKKCV